MDANFEIGSRKKSIKSLPQALLSLVGSNNKNFTLGWLKSVTDIINDMKSSEEVGFPVLKGGIIQEEMERLSSDYDEGEREDLGLKIEDELCALIVQLNQLMVQRRDALNEYLDLKGSIRIFCRVRPFLTHETFGFQKSIFDLDSSNVVLRIAETKCKMYNFDKVFHPSSTQEEVFSEIEPVIKSALDGYNVCIFAYGQTGTGKTYTMEGQPHNPGMVPLGIKSMFNQAENRNCEFMFTFSMLEIYMGNLRDLLAPKTKNSHFQKPPSLLIKTDSEGDVEIENLVAIQVNNFDQVKKLYDIGTRFRSTGSTMANSTSSRSHCLIRITLTSTGSRERRRERNKLWMIDLGGSERLLKTQATGKRLEEGKAINLSLSALADVIDALQSKKPHVPFRNSKLTQVLRDSLGSDSKTLMLVHVSPNEDDLCETICTFGFATRVRSIRFEKEDEPIEVKAKKEQLIAELEQQMKRLENESQELQIKIKDLNTKLQQLKGIAEFSDTNSNLSYTCNESINISQTNTKTSSSKVPSFMRPTVCSQRKKGVISHQYSLFNNNNRKKPPVPRKKGPASVYAESLISPIKEFKKFKCKSDCVSEYSVSTSEYEVKEVIFPEEEMLTRNGDFVGEIRIAKWLHVASGNNYNRWNKRVMSVPVENWSGVCNDDDIMKPYEKYHMDFEAEICKHGIGTDISVTETMLESEGNDAESGVKETKLDTETGEYRILRLFRTIWGIAMLGSGIGSVGIGNDFFTALVL